MESRWPSIVLTRPEKRLVYDATRKNRVEKIVHDAGYHFSYFGDIVYKLESWGHADQFNKAPFNDPKHIEKCKDNGEDFLMRKGRRKIEFEFDDD